MPSIHPTAIVEDGAQIADTVEIGPFAYIGAQAILESGVKIGPRANVLGRTRLGEAVVVHTGVVLGDDPQIIGLKPEAVGQLVVGPRTIIREYATLHAGWRSENGRGETTIGADCFLMGGCHIGHDCVIGDKCVIANNVAFGGHSVLGYQVWVGGQAAAHQFTRIGDHAFVGGGAILVADVPPFCSAIGNHAYLSGLNLVGLKRRGFSREAMNTLRKTYKELFLGEGSFEARLSSVEETYGSSEEVATLTGFIRAGGRRAVCQAARS